MVPRILFNQSIDRPTGRGSKGGWASFASTPAKVSRSNDHSSFVFAACCFALREESDVRKFKKNTRRPLLLSPSVPIFVQSRAEQTVCLDRVRVARVARYLSNNFVRFSVSGEWGG